MANFFLFKYSFCQIDPHLFTDQSGASLTEEYHNDRFYNELESAYNKKLTPALNFFATKTARNGTQSPEIYANTIEQCIDGVVTMQVRNNKVKKIIPIDSKEAKEIGHFPPCWVIIDTRPNSHLILIQKSEAFNSPNTVIEMIENWVTQTFSLSMIGWGFKASKRQCTGSIWDIVQMRLSADSTERVKTLSIKFTEKKANKKNEVDSLLQTLLAKFAAPEGEIRLNSGKASNPAFLNQENDDLVNTINLLVENKYRLKVAFEKSGSFEYGKGAEVIYGIDDNRIEAFGREQIITDNGTQDYELIIWLNRIAPEESIHSYAEYQPKRKRRNASK